MIYILLIVFKILYIIGVLKCKGLRGMAYVISLQGPMASGKTAFASFFLFDIDKWLTFSGRAIYRYEVTIHFLLLF